MDTNLHKLFIRDQFVKIRGQKIIRIYFLFFRNIMTNSKIFSAICFGLLLTFCGCGDGLLPVNGTVKFSDGTSLDRGQVVFSGAKYQFYGTIQSDGTFHLNGLNGKTGLPEGSYEIKVGATDDNDQPMIADTNPNPESFEVKKNQKNVCTITVEKAEIKK